LDDAHQHPYFFSKGNKKKSIHHVYWRLQG
jgi:hypothetical protein